MTAYGHRDGEKMSAGKNGTVEVSDGRIIVKNPSDGGKEARISWSKGIKLFVNDVEAAEGVAVFEESKIRVEIENREPERKFEISVADDRLSASVTVQYRNGLKYVLKNRLAANELTLDVMSSGRIECQPYSLEEARSILKEKGIIYGIIEESLTEAITNGSGTPVVIAKGEKPTDGTDDIIDLKFHDDKKFIEVNDRVDFYSIGRVISVEPGVLIAEKISGNEGKSGTDVFGNPVPEKKGKRVALQSGKGASLSEDGMKVYSDILGKPDIKGDIVSVHEVYEIQSNVDVSTGNIEFSGDVVIKGSILDGMKVKAGNSVVVFGSVTGGQITAGGDVTVYKNIIGSSVKAGCNDFLKYSIMDQLESIGKVILEIFSAARVLKETGKVPKIYKDGQIIKLLIDTKFNNLNKQVIEFRDILADNKGSLDMDTLRLGAKLVKYLMGNGAILIEDYNILKTYGDEIEERISALNSGIKEPSHITAYYVQNSTLSTSGNIVITGKGCYTSELSCRGDVIAERIGSVTRGGTIEAMGEVRLYELGSLGGAQTTVAAGKDSTISCEIAHVNSVIKIGEMSNKLDASVRKLKACLYKGELFIEKSKM